MAKNKKFRLIDAILSVITVVFVAEAAAPAAAIGNSQFFWWIFLIIAFCCRTDWWFPSWAPPTTTRAVCTTGCAARSATSGATRVSWYYWINFRCGWPRSPSCSLRPSR